MLHKVIERGECVSRLFEAHWGEVHPLHLLYRASPAGLRDNKGLPVIVLNRTGHLLGRQGDILDFKGEGFYQEARYRFRFIGFAYLSAQTLKCLLSDIWKAVPVYANQDVEHRPRIQLDCPIKRLRNI